MMVKVIRASFALLLLSTCFAETSFASEGLENTLAESAGISEQEAKQLVKRTFQAIEAELVAGRSVSIRNFGRFHVVPRKARKGRNPQTGAEISIPARKYPKFASSNGLKKRLNK